MNALSIRGVSVVGFLVLATACTAPSAEWIAQPEARSEGLTFYGTSKSDIWCQSRSKLEHWDGKAWAVVPPGSPPLSPLTTAAPGKILASAGTNVFLVDAAGMRTEVTYPHAATSMTTVSAVRGKELTVVSADGRLYRFDGQTMTDIGPGTPGGRLLAVFSPTDVWAASEEPTGLSPASVEQGVYPAGLTHFDGTRWAEVNSGEPFSSQAPLRRFSPSIPATSKIVGGSYFDGARLLSLSLPPPRGEYFYWSASGRLAQIVGFSGGASGANVYKEVDLGNGRTGYSMVDINLVIAMTYVSLEWDGKQWVNERTIGTTEKCGGVYCKGDSSGFGGELTDGTILVIASQEEKGGGFFVMTP